MGSLIFQSEEILYSISTTFDLHHTLSIVMSPANEHDSTKFVDVIENISDFINESMVKEIVSVCRQGL